MTHSDFMKDINKQARTRMENLLKRCTEPQQKIFSRMYPDGVPDEKVDWALSQIERTLNKED